MVDQYGNYYDGVKEEIPNAATGDQPSYDDLLGFSPYVEAIKEFLINPDTEPPLTLSIEGSWGSGKSSFIRQLIKELEANGEYTVLFNAWRHDKEDVMWAAFALEFIRQISRKLSTYKFVKAEIKLFISRIRWVNRRGDILKIISVIIFIIGYIAYVNSKWSDWISSLSTQLMLISLLGIGFPIYISILSVLPNLKKLLGNSVYANLKKCIKKPDYENRTTFIEEFHEDFKNIVKCYAGENKVFVFIDDLDRCEVPKAADLMQALNLMISDDPHLIFIIGMDRLKVASGVAVKYEKLLPYFQSLSKNYETPVVQNKDYYKGLEYGYEYLEKFIQLPFSVPQPEISDLQELVCAERKKFIKPKTKFFSLTREVKKSYKNGRNFFEKIKYLSKKEKDTSISPNVSETYIKIENITARKEINDSNNDKAYKSNETQKIFIESIKTIVKPDSNTVRKIILMVLPALDYNPRRIKQFTNLLRLKTFIAIETGLFCSNEDNSSEVPITIEKLGKFVAITLKWPLIVSDLSLNRKLLDELQVISLATSSKVENVSNESEYWAPQEKLIDLASDEVKYWITQKKLIDLLRYGYFEKDGSINKEFEKIYSLSGLKIDKLLQTSPKIDKDTIISISDKNKRILETNFQDVRDKEKAWSDLYALTTHKDDLLRYIAVKSLGSAFFYMPDKQRAWNDLHNLTTNEAFQVRLIIAKSFGSAFSHIPDKQQALIDLIKLSDDKDSNVRIHANYSLGKVSIFNASQAVKEEDYKNELEKAITFFEMASKESSEEFNPSKFCLPFYRSFHAILFKKQDAREEVNKYLIESKAAIKGSESKEILFEAVNTLAKTLEEVQNLQNMDFQTMRNELSSYKKYCDRAAELLRNAEEILPFAAGAMRKGLPILDRNLKDLHEKIQEKTKTVFQESRGTKTEEIANVINKEVQKWEISSQEELAQSIDNIAYILKTKTADTPENEYIMNKIETLRNEKDLTKQYETLLFIISQIPIVEIVPEGIIWKNQANAKKLDNFSQETDETIVSLKPGVREEIVISSGIEVGGTGAKHIVTIPLQEISYDELKDDLSRIKSKEVSKLSKLPDRLAMKIEEYLLENNREDLIEELK